MKNLLLLLTFLSTGFLSCKKDDAQPTVEAENLSLTNATMVAEGKLSFVKEGNAGLVKIYKQQNGKYVLGLEEMSLNTGTSMYIYLSPTKEVSSSSLVVCSVISLNGNVVQPLPSNVDVTVFRYVLILTKRTGEAVAIAELN